MANKSKLPLVMALAAVFTTGVAGFLAMSTAGSDSSSAAAAGSGGAAPSPPAHVIEAPRRASVPALEPALAPAPAGAAQPPALHRNRMARDVKREQIWSALGREHQLDPAAPGSAAPDQETAKRLPELDPEYIRSAIAEQLVPVAIECYESALADDPKLAGKLVAEFTLIGVEEVGGVVEESSIKADESTLDSEFVRECVRESMMAVTFDSPPDGGQVLVTYAFEFSPED